MIRPTASNILVKLMRRPGALAGGVVLTIPDKAKRWEETTLEVEIVQIGPFVDHVHPGDVALIEGHAGKWIDNELTPDSSETYRMVDESDILLVRTPVEGA